MPPRLIPHPAPQGSNYPNSQGGSPLQLLTRFWLVMITLGQSLLYLYLLKMG